MPDTPTPSLSLDQKRQVLTRFSKAIKREAHNLQQRPDLLYQQLYNRLQWDEEPMAQVLSPEFERRTAPRAAPWMRTRTPYRESEALIRTLAGHTNSVTSCCISPDGRWVVSGSWDHTLKVWDVETGQVHTELVLLGSIKSLELHPRRPLLVCGGEGGSVYFVDLMGIEYGPIIVTAVDFGGRPVVRCPACQTVLPLQENWLGQVVSCPQPGCEGRMKVNLFVCSVARAEPYQRLSVHQVY